MNLVGSNLDSEVYHCLPKGKHSEAAHEKRLLCAQNVPRMGWGGYVGVGWVIQGWVGHSLVRLNGIFFQFTFNLFTNDSNAKK